MFNLEFRRSEKNWLVNKSIKLQDHLKLEKQAVKC